VDNTQRLREIEERLAKERAELAAKVAAEPSEKGTTGEGAVDKPALVKKPFPGSGMSSSKNPFGGAKPVDTEKALKKVGEKLAKASIMTTPTTTTATKTVTAAVAEEDMAAK
jgi:hypothetical protein